MDLQQLILKLMEIRFSAGNMPVACFDSTGELLGRVNRLDYKLANYGKAISLSVYVKRDPSEDEEEGQ